MSKQFLVQNKHEFLRVCMSVAVAISFFAASVNAINHPGVVPLWENPSVTWKQPEKFPEEKPVVVIIPSYRNADWYSYNLDSVFAQKYNNYRIIYIDDCSPDQTGHLVANYIKEKGFEQKVKLIRNEKRVGALENLYNAIHSCSDNEIVVTIDGDDWFACNNALQLVNQVYSENNIWMTYGQFIRYPMDYIGVCEELPQIVVEKKLYRKCGGYSHLRTFYAGLFKKIKKEDLMYNDIFYPMSWDVAMMIPMLEMADGKFKFIPHILYVYNCFTPLNDHKIDPLFQFNLDRQIRSKKPYEPIEKCW